MKLDYINMDRILEIDRGWLGVLKDQRKENNIHEAFENEVIIKHLDESYLHYKNAFYVENDELILVITEHLGYFIFHIEDLGFYNEYKMGEYSLDKNSKIEVDESPDATMGFKTNIDLRLMSLGGLTYIGKSRVDGLKMYSINIIKFIQENKTLKFIRPGDLKLRHIKNIIGEEIYPIMNLKKNIFCENGL